MRNTPERTVTLPTAVAAVITLVISLFGIELPGEVAAGITTLVVWGVAFFLHSAKATAGTLATAFVTVAVWALSMAGVDVPPDAATSLSTAALFLFGWITTEYNQQPNTSGP